MSGFYGGWIDKLGFRVVDMFQSLPALVLLITILFDLRIGALATCARPRPRERPCRVASRARPDAVDHVEPIRRVGRVIGASDRRIMLKYILPNVFHLIILQSTLRLGAFVLIEASLSFPRLWHEAAVPVVGSDAQPGRPQLDAL